MEPKNPQCPLVPTAGRSPEVAVGAGPDWPPDGRALDQRGCDAAAHGRRAAELQRTTSTQEALGHPAASDHPVTTSPGQVTSLSPNLLVCPPCPKPCHIPSCPNLCLLVCLPSHMVTLSHGMSPRGPLLISVHHVPKPFPTPPLHVRMSPHHSVSPCVPMSPSHVISAHISSAVGTRVSR